jgi:hypothetical protein
VFPAPNDTDDTPILVAVIGVLSAAPVEDNLNNWLAAISHPYYAAVRNIMSTLATSQLGSVGPTTTN